ncbi:MAG: type III pantothenate kinase [Gemmatimonadetes bacterium]|nr:type III pantothenate kinase [Gemmatimonadota bacterium]
MTHLVVDVGNTETVVGIFRPGSLEVSGHWRYTTALPRTSDELLLLYRTFLREAGVGAEAIARVVVGSVSPVQTDLLRRTLPGLSPARLHILGGAEGLPIRLDVEEPGTVGADRIANTLAASQLYDQDTIVVDLGTAITYDCIAAGGVFLGGVIAPGILAGQEWLALRTAKLPRVELVPPNTVIGRRTETCLQSGLFFSAVDALDGIVGRIKAEWGRPEVQVVATGGHATVVAGHSRTIQRVDPYLTLVGLELAGRYLDGEVTGRRRS